MKTIVSLLIVAVLVAGCGSRCYHGKLSVVYLDKASEERNTRQLSDYSLYIDGQSQPINPQSDGSFQLCDLKKKKHPDRVMVMLDGRKVPSAQTYTERGDEKDPWIINVAGPVEGSPAGIDTAWVLPNTGTIRPGPRMN